MKVWLQCRVYTVLIGKTENLEVQLRPRGATSRTTRTLNTLVYCSVCTSDHYLHQRGCVGWLVAWFRWDVFQHLHSFLSICRNLDEKIQACRRCVSIKVTWFSVIKGDCWALAEVELSSTDLSVTKICCFIVICWYSNWQFRQIGKDLSLQLLLGGFYGGRCPVSSSFAPSSGASPTAGYNIISVSVTAPQPPYTVVLQMFMSIQLHLLPFSMNFFSVLSFWFLTAGPETLQR